MALLDIFKAPKIRRFEHKPIYWDPAKERREERMERAKQELGLEKGGSTYKPVIRRGAFHEQRKTASRERQNRILRLLLIAFVIIALLYWLF